MANERFTSLPAEKQARIVNAGFKVFGAGDYKHASTDQIAAEAGISKGYLFYYFRNKKEFYLYLYELAREMTKKCVLDPRFEEITDFFELMEYSAQRKFEMAAGYPHVFSFILRTFQSRKEEVSEELNRRFQAETNHLFAAYFKNIDFSRFKDSVDPAYLLRIMNWLAEGYMMEKQRSAEAVSPGSMMEDFRRWADFLKQLVYKEEYL